MPYCTEEDILLEMSEAELAKLSGDPTGVTINSDRVDYAISNGDALIDSYLKGRYSVPFETEISHLIYKLSIDLSISNLYEYSYSKTMVPQTISNRKLYAINQLKGLQKGEFYLDFATPGFDSPPPLISNKEDSDRMFDEETFEEFID